MKKISTKDLWNKFNESGDPEKHIITNLELIELSERLKDIEDFLRICNPATLGIVINKMSVDNVIFHRNYNSNFP